MKIRTLTIGVSLSEDDFYSYEEHSGTSINLVEVKLRRAIATLRSVSMPLSEARYEVQTLRVSLNSFEQWLNSKDGDENLNRLRQLDNVLASLDIVMCSIGNCQASSSLLLVPSYLSISARFSCSFSVTNYGSGSLADFDRCLKAAETILSVGKISEDGLRNFSFCASFNCPPNVPFFPASYHDESKAPTITVGLESGDLLFLSFHGAETFAEAKSNLFLTLSQVLMPLQKLLELACIENDVIYGGIDASINPGLTPQDSVGAGLEILGPHYFGHAGTMAAVAVITSTLNSLRASDSLKIIGYSGLMLPIVEDLQLAQRASESPSSFTIRDLVAYSSVCGVGLDTVPIPGDSSPESIAWIMMDLGAISFRQNKPLTCR